MEYYPLLSYAKDFRLYTEERLVCKERFCSHWLQGQELTLVRLEAGEKSDELEFPVVQATEDGSLHQSSGNGLEENAVI